jgi:hypothetical protein
MLKICKNIFTRTFACKKFKAYINYLTKKMVFIPLIDVLNISIILIMIIAFANSKNIKFLRKYLNKNIVLEKY